MNLSKYCAAAALMLPVVLSAQTVDKSIKPGKGLYELVYAEKANAVFVAGTGARGENSAAVYKLDPKTLEVVQTIDVNEAPAFGLGINQKTQTIYSSNTRANSVHAIDAATGKIIATIKNGAEKSHTREIVVDEAENKVYVSDVGYGIWVIDGKTNTFSHMIEDAGKSLTGLALDEKAKRLFIVDMRSNKIVRYDLKKKAVIDSFATGGEGAINVARDPKTKTLFVSHQRSGDVTVLEEGGKLLKTVPAGKGALGITFNPVNNKVYVANRQDGTVYVTNKAKSGPRPKPGETPQPQQEDTNGDTVTRIIL